MSTTINQKMALIRESERLNKKEFAELIGVIYSSYVHYENGRSVPSTEVVMRMLNHPQLEKYALWFMTEKIAPAAGQIAPALAHVGSDNQDSRHSDQKTG